MNNARRRRLLPILGLLASLIMTAQFARPPGVVYAGTGPIVTAPPSNTEPTFDGVCDNSSEYQDATVTQITVTPAGKTVSVYLKHTANFFYACFALPPLTASSFVALYIDRDNDAGGGDSDDFAIAARPNNTSNANYWDSASGNYNGADPGGWSAKSVVDAEFGWIGSEIRVSRQTMGGWRRTAGMALFYHWYSGVGDDYAWPANNIWANPQLWGNAKLLTGEVDIGQSTTVPVVDGVCAAEGEYADANSVAFPTPAGTTRAYLEHSTSDLYICLANLAIPSVGTNTGPNAAVYINRAGNGGNSTSVDDLAFWISYAGTAGSGRGSGAAYSGPAPGGFTATRSVNGAVNWSAEFRISSATLGGGWGRDINLAVVEQWVAYGGNDFGWPTAYFWSLPGTWGLAHLTTTPSTAALDIVPTAIEVIQSIQDLNNSVVLIANKRTFARVHVSSAPATSGVEARLYGYRNGLSLGPALLPANPGGVINVLPAPNRALVNDSFLFELPSAWVGPGAITLSAVVNPFNSVDEGNYLNNSVSTGNLNFLSTKTLNIRLINYEYVKFNGTLISTSSFDQSMLESQLRREYPISSLSSTRRTFRHWGAFLTSCSSFPWICIGDTPDAVAMNADLIGLRLLLEPFTSAVYYGMVADSGGFVRGMSPGPLSAVGPTGVPGVNANPVNASSWDFDQTYGDWYGAHEIGHALGQPHRGACGDERLPSDPVYPYPGGIIGGPAGDTTRFYGFDVGDGSLGLGRRVIPNTGTDMMTYCVNQWISDLAYTGVRDHIQARFLAGSQSAVPAYTPYLNGDYLAVYGQVDITHQAAGFSMLWRQAEAGEIPPLVAGPYHIQLLDADKGVLADYPFTPMLDSDASATDAEVGLIGQIVDFVRGTRQVAIYSDLAKKVIGLADISANAPAVTITDRSGGRSLPANGPVTLSWDGRDSDGDPLTYTILYSFDNRSTWRPLGTGLIANSLTLDAAEFEGTHGVSTGYLRVIANDGALTGSSDSGPFVVAGKAPEASISSPARNSSYHYGQTVSLSGEGQDFEDGTLNDAQLAWSSDLDGLLGTGHSLHPALLSPGTHTITLQATDSHGQTDTATTAITISADETLPGPTLEANPESMLFLFELGGANPAPQTLNVRNSGGGSIAWTASSDASWLTLSIAAGTNAGGIGVSVDRSHLAIRQPNVAHIQLQAAGASGSPKTIKVIAQVTNPGTANYLPLLLR